MLQTVDSEPSRMIRRFDARPFWCALYVTFSDFFRCERICRRLVPHPQRELNEQENP